jgi:hypothetical protein
MIEKGTDLALRINKSVDEIIKQNSEIVNNIDDLGDEITEFINSDSKVIDLDHTLKDSFKTTILNALKEKFQKYL